MRVLGQQTLLRPFIFVCFFLFKCPGSLGVLQKQQQDVLFIIRKIFVYEWIMFRMQWIIWCVNLESVWIGSAKDSFAVINLY